MTFPCASKRGNICWGHKMYLKKSETLFVSRTQMFCCSNVARAGKQGNNYVRNNVSSFATASNFTSMNYWGHQSVSHVVIIILAGDRNVITDKGDMYLPYQRLNKCILHKKLKINSRDKGVKVHAGLVLGPNCIPHE